MSIAKILVPVFGSAEDSVCLATAFAAAKPFNAHVQALFARPDPREAVVAGGMPVSGSVVQALLEAQDRFAVAAIRNARQSLAAEAEKAQVRIVAEPIAAERVTASYRETTGRLERVMREMLRFCDLVVLPPSIDGDPDVHDVLVGILTKAERPVLLAPKAAPAEIGTVIGAGWDGSTSASHALTAALPYLQNAHSLMLVAITPKGKEDDGSANQAKEYLALHGVETQIRSVEPNGRGVAGTLLDTAAAAGCDLLVIGGYGHSHLRESVFGGVTQYIIGHATMPVLLAH